MADLNQQIGYPNNMGNVQRSGQQPLQYPYNNNLMMNTPYDNYMGRVNQQPQQNILSNQFLKCRPVSSKEEARAAQIDLDGSLWVFTDVGNEKIYTKRINTDGTASFITYARIEDENPYAPTGDFVTRDEFNKVIQALMAAMQPANSQEPVPAQSNIEKQNDQAPLMKF